MHVHDPIVWGVAAPVDKSAGTSFTVANDSHPTPPPRTARTKSSVSPGLATFQADYFPSTPRNYSFVGPGCCPARSQEEDSHAGSIQVPSAAQRGSAMESSLCIKPHDVSLSGFQRVEPSRPSTQIGSSTVCYVLDSEPWRTPGALVGRCYA